MTARKRFLHLLYLILCSIFLTFCAGCIHAPSDDPSTSTGETMSIELPPETLSETHTHSDSDTSAEETEETTVSAVLPPETGQDYPSDHPYIFKNTTETVYTTANLNLRAAPSTEAAIVTTLPLSSAITRTGYHEEWSRLNFGGAVVYAASAYLTTEAPNIPDIDLNVEDLDATIQHFGYNPYGSRDVNNIPSDIFRYIKDCGKWATFLQDTGKKQIYLTFDMGYENGYTAQFLDILKKYEVKAVFFLVGDYAETAPDLVQRMIDEGHILGNHSYGHPAGGVPSLSAEAQIADTMYMHNLIKDRFGYEMTLYRFPSGTFSIQSLELISRLGYDHVFYSFAYRDYLVDDQPDPTEALNTCLEQLHPGAIYMFHTVSSTNAAIFDDFIEGVLARGYTFGEYPSH